MAQSLYALAFLACPVGMGLMMWLMMRGKKNQPVPEGTSAPKQAELARLQAEIDQLRATTRGVGAGASAENAGTVQPTP
ncbi:MAG: hypothetical protein ACR2FG_11180 [Marmoricola sp.]